MLSNYTTSTFILFFMRAEFVFADPSHSIVLFFSAFCKRFSLRFSFSIKKSAKRPFLRFAAPFD